jgi:hypothetical protein
MPREEEATTESRSGKLSPEVDEALAADEPGSLESELVDALRDRLAELDAIAWNLPLRAAPGDGNAGP